MVAAPPNNSSLYVGRYSPSNSVYLIGKQHFDRPEEESLICDLVT